MTGPLMDFDAYLGRLGFEHAPPPTLDTLRTLQLRHTMAFPFETLSTLLAEPVPLDLPSLQRKLLHEGRGGYCYELNVLFMSLLAQLGYAVRGVTGRVVTDGGDVAQAARTHMALHVVVDEVPWLVDVGFGGMVPTAPLRLDTGHVQGTPHEPYRITRHAGGYTLLAQVAGQWRALYVFDLQPQSSIDFEVGNWYVSTHPDSPFRGQLMVAKVGTGLRRTLHDGRYTVHRLGEPSQQRELESARAVIGVMEADFDIRVPSHPDLHAAIARRLEPDASAA